jgi:aldoxime dehydratase
MAKEPGRSHELVALAPSPRFLPPDWQPPAAAWSVSFAQHTTPVVMAYFGTQLGSGDAAPIGPRVGKFFDYAEGPDNAEAAIYRDRAGCLTVLSSAYWTDPARYESWQKTSGFAAWWGDRGRLTDGQGHFREVLTVAPDRIETIFSYDCLVGVAKTGLKTGQCPVGGPIREHNYWGSMRDRLTVSANDGLCSAYGDRLPRLGSTVTAHRRLRVVVPENLAVIRSGQDWTDCAGAELAQYDDSVRPALVEGMKFLRDHPDDTGCCDLRFAEETSLDGTPLKKSFGLGYFLTLGHLEKWASTHPTHLAIFAKFLTMVREHRADLKLKLWHEVSVLPTAGQVFEYIN